MIIKPCQKKEGRRAVLDLSMDAGLDITAAWGKPTAQLSWFCKIAQEGRPCPTRLLAREKRTAASNA
jgi:hypothetical protein